MDLAELAWILTNRRMYLHRVDLLDDPFEGSIPKPVVDERDAFFDKEGVARLRATVPGVNMNVRACCYVNCWRMGNDESEAMWRLYCGNAGGVALRTTYGRLVDSISHEPFAYIGCVRYLDYETDGFSHRTLFDPIMHKRASFAHESEIRIVKSLREAWSKPNMARPDGMTIDWDVEAVAEDLFVSPYGPEWYRDAVAGTVKSVIPSLADRVRWSRMRADPRF